MFRFLTSEEKATVIRDYAKQYGISRFIETGTSVGATVAAVLDDFTSIITIELDRATWDSACNRFAPFVDKVMCVQGDSGSVLPFLIPTIEQPILFWLDGHYSGGGTARGDIDTPIVSELRAAVCAPVGSVILIDDARLFGGMEEHTEEFKDYPEVTWVSDLAVEHGFDFSLEADIIRLTPDV